MKKTYTTLLLCSALSVLAPFAHASTTETEKKNAVPAATADPANRMIDDVVVQDAMAEFKSLSRVEKKSRMNEVKKLMKDYKAQKSMDATGSTNTLLLAILAILLPPLAVALHENGINGKFWLSLLLSLLFWLPGVIYALIVVL